MHVRTVAGLAVGALLLLPAAASAATKKVEAGPFTNSARGALGEAAADANAFFRKTTTIHQGDRVRFEINGFHNVLFPGGEDPPPLLIPDPSTPVAGVNDAAGTPFWFNGQPTVSFNPAVAAPSGGRTYDGSEMRNSGLPPEEGAPEPYTLRFPKRGRYNYLCSIHSGMTGTVNVVKRSQRIPSARADRRVARKELQSHIEAAGELTTGEDLNLTNTLQAGNDTRRGTAIFKFFPSAPTAKVGDTLTLQMPARSSEIHTFTFGPLKAAETDPNQYVDEIAEGFATSFDPRAIYPSENPAAGLATFSGAGQHGNGYFNTGIIDSDPASPLPRSMQVKLGAAGTYAFICLVHPFMRDTLTVTP
jgi:plastocyanin